MTGSWIPVFWIAVACDPDAATLALAALEPLVARHVARQGLVSVPAAAAPVTSGLGGA